MLIDNLTLFALIVEKGSLVAAGREAGLSSTTVSERLAALEAHYGVVLLNRTTRSISLTDEGQMVLERARHILAEIQDLESQVKYGADSLSGLIRISAPHDLGRSLIAAEVAQFLEDHPAVRVDLLLSDGFEDIVGGGIDLALRFGKTSDSSLRVRPLRYVRRIACAAPAYLARHPAPRRPEDLRDHNCLLMRFGGTLDYLWPFEVDGQFVSINVQGDRSTNDGALVREWAIAGYGIALKSELDVGPALRDGSLVEILPDHAAPALPLQMLFPPSRTQPRRVKALAERLMARLKGD